MVFTVLEVGDPDTLAHAARAATSEHVLVVQPGAVPLPGATNGLAAALAAGSVVGGRSIRGHEDHYGWMLAPARFGVLPFEPSPIATPTGERGAAELVRGEIDAPTTGCFAADRALLVEPLPDDPLAAMIELGARARARGGRVVCRPALAFTAPPFDADDRGSAAALVALARLRPELRGAHRDVPSVRRRGIVRETRLGGGARALVRRPLPAVTVLTHGARVAASIVSALTPAVARHRHAADPAAELRRELQRRGDRYVLLADGARFPSSDAFEALVERIELSEQVAAAAPDAAALGGACVLLAPGRIPQHVEPDGATLAAALETLYAGARACGRVALPAAPADGAIAPPAASLEGVFLAGSRPELTRTTLDALLGELPRERVVAISASSARTRGTLLGSYPILERLEDPVDPLLGGALSVALGELRADLVLVCADDVLIPPGTIARLRAAFARLPALGAAFPRANGTGAAEELHDVAYGNMEEMKQFAARRAEAFPRDTERIDDAAIPACLLARHALEAIGGIDERLGPTRWGIADLVLRLRAAGYDAVRCDDAYVHRFTAADSGNAAAVPPAALEREFRRRWGFGQLGAIGESERGAAIAAGFDPARRVPFRRRSELVAGVASVQSVVALPVADAVELDDAERFLRRALPALEAGDGVEIVVLLDGDVASVDAIARLRAVLAADSRPLEQTPNVVVSRVALAEWSPPPGARVVVAAGHERDALAAAERIDAGRVASLKQAAR